MPVDAEMSLSQDAALLAQTDAPSPWQQALQLGLTAYQRGQFSEAIAHWQTALLTLSSAPENLLTRAYLLNNLSAAYEALGQHTQAQQQLEESLSIIQNWPTQTLAYWEISARILNRQGQMFWQQGQTQQALAHWQQAEKHYREAEARAPESSEQDAEQNSGQDSGLISSQINQALARQELGFNAAALRQLTGLAQSLDQLSPRLRLAAARELGKAFRRVGDFSTAQAVLIAGWQAANLAPAAELGALEASTERSLVALELGHTLRQLSHRTMAIGKTKQAQTEASEALLQYESVSSSPKLQAQAQLNQLSYLIEMGQLEAAQALWPQISLSDLPSGRANVEAYISYAHSLICLQAPNSVSCIRQEWQNERSQTAIAASITANEPQWTAIGKVLSQAIQQSRALSDPLLESYALGELGHAYELSGQREEAIALTRQALRLLEDKQLPDAAYRWEWQLGRLYEDRDQNQVGQPALLAYQQAIASLDAVRQNLLVIDPQVQFSFRDNVEPLYREYVSLLLRQSAGDRTVESAKEQQSLKAAVNTLDALQLTELENFLGCNLSQLVNLNEGEIDPQAAKIYPIILPDQLAIILAIPQQPLRYVSVPVRQSTIEATLRDLRTNLTLPGKTPAVLDSASRLYDWLIAPLAPMLAENKQIQTLVFVPDGALRNIPMGVLYDGQQYLVEKDYAIAIAPQLNLFAPRKTQQQLQILRGGIGLPQTVRGQQFPPIELVQAELNQIPEAFTVAPPLLNEAFTQANIAQQLATQQYSAIHWKTHGVFSADPAETFLVAYGDGITANELSELVQSASAQRAEPLELLVLSACETARGDQRAVLGLAGIAVRAGARSTLSTLWRADDGANTQLMADFYQSLNQGRTKAQALQQAQKTLLNEAGYLAPYYWASYVLVGNWL